MCQLATVTLFHSAQQHCRGFGSPEDLSERLKIWGGVNSQLRSAPHCQCVDIPLQQSEDG